MTWELERRDDTLHVNFHMPVSEGWGDLFDALKAELELGARVVVFADDLPLVSLTTREVFFALINYLIGSGIEVRREA